MREGRSAKWAGVRVGTYDYPRMTLNAFARAMNIVAGIDLFENFRWADDGGYIPPDPVDETAWSGGQNG